MIKEVMWDRNKYFGTHSEVFGDPREASKNHGSKIMVRKINIFFRKIPIVLLIFLLFLNGLAVFIKLCQVIANSMF